MNKALDHPLAFSIHTRLREFYLQKNAGTGYGRKLLDVGCGLGYFMEVFSPLLKTFGVEREFNSIVKTKDRGSKLIVQGDASSLPFDNDTFDIVLCSELLEHLPDDRDRIVLCEIGRVLKQGGTVIITVPAKEGVRSRSKLRNMGHDNPKGGEYHYKVGYTESELCSLIQAIPNLKVKRKQYSMVLFGELIMDAMKWIYFKKHRMKEHSDIMEVKNNTAFKICKSIVPILKYLCIVEDFVLSPLLKGHILIVVAEKKHSLTEEKSEHGTAKHSA